MSEMRNVKNQIKALTEPSLTNLLGLQYCFSFELVVILKHKLNTEIFISFLSIDLKSLKYNFPAINSWLCLEYFFKHFIIVLRPSTLHMVSDMWFYFSQNIVFGERS